MCAAMVGVFFVMAVVVIKSVVITLIEKMKCPVNVCVLFQIKNVAYKRDGQMPNI